MVQIGPLLLVLGGIVGLVLLALGARGLWFVLRIYQNEPIAIADAPNNLGPVTVSGTASADEGTVEAPFTGTECLVCEWEIHEREGWTPLLGESRTVDDGLRGGPFRLKDETASCRVKPAGSVRHLSTHEVTVSGGETPPPRIRDLVEANPEVFHDDGNRRDGALQTGKDYVFVERRLEPGETCQVYGFAHYDSSGDHRGGDVNVRIDVIGVRHMLLSDTDVTSAAWKLGKVALVPTAVGLAVLSLVSVLLYATGTLVV